MSDVEKKTIWKNRGDSGTK